MSGNTWNRPAPPGFQGFREDLPLGVYWRHLPHWRQVGATYFVTFRLADSLPQSKLRELEAVKVDWARKNKILPPRQGKGADYQSALRGTGIPRAHWQAFARMVTAKVEAWLDEGMGECWLNRTEVSQLVGESLQHLDDDQYELGCYIVMPNHVHAIIRPLQPEALPLEKVLQGRKRRTAREINALLGRDGAFWQAESFDRIIRDEDHLYRCMQYVGRNPRNAGLAPGQFRMWVRPAWKTLGWTFDETCISGRTDW